MTITNTKIVSEVATVQIRAQNETVLVDFVRIVGNKSNSCCESILSYHVPLDQLWLYLFHLSFNAVHHFHDFALKLCWSGWSRLEFRIENHLIVLQSCKISRLINLACTRLFQSLKLLVREGN